MRRHWAGFMLLTFLHVSDDAHAQAWYGPNSTCARTPPARDSASLTQAAVARKEIEAQYARLAQAIRRKDFDAMVAVYASDFRAWTTSGEVWSREQALTYGRGGLLNVRHTYHISNTIVGLTVCGDTAEATVLQYWNRNQPMRGRLRRVDTHAVQDEEWVRTPQGWKRGNIYNVRNGPAFVDGKRVNTNLAFDPEAPEYDPHDAHPKRPASDTLLRIANDRGVAAALDAARLLRSSNDYYVSEVELNTLGYGLLESKRAADAIAVFKLNATTYPRSANVHDSLGEAYLVKGDTALAVRSYRRALELNPESTSAAAALRALVVQRK